MFPSIAENGFEEMQNQWVRLHQDNEEEVGIYCVVFYCSLNY